MHLVASRISLEIAVPSMPAGEARGAGDGLAGRDHLQATAISSLMAASSSRSYLARRALVVAQAALRNAASILGDGDRTAARASPFGTTRIGDAQVESFGASDRAARED